MTPQEVPFSNLKKMLEAFKTATTLNLKHCPQDPSQVPLTPFPLVADQSGQLQYALMFDGFNRYVESEARALLNPALIEDILTWQKNTMPVPAEDMDALFARVNAQQPAVAASLQKFKHLKADYEYLKKMLEDDKLPLIVKLTTRFQLLAEICASITVMSITLHKLKEGLPSS